MAGEVILVVDDGKENREFIVDVVLKPNGYNAIVAKDGVECLKLIAQHNPDLILLDYQMPNMNGVEVLQAMSQRNINIPVIMMTFYGSEEVAIEVYRLGVRDYVRKPYTPEEMLLAIERSLEDVRLRREKDALTERLIQSNRDLQFRLQELNVLYSIGKSVTGITDLDLLLPRIVDAAIKVTDAEEGFLHLIKDKKLFCYASKPHNQPRAVPMHVEVQDRMAEQVIKSAQPIIVAPDENSRAKNSTSAACAPLIIRGQVIGVLGVRNATPESRIFGRHDSALLSALTDYAAIAIENSRNYEALHNAKELEKDKIRSMFQRFVPPQVVDQILEQPERLQLGGIRQEITVLFADIRGYSAYAEKLPPEKVVDMLNDYLSLAANVILGYGGTLDKYVGDGLMAIFNAPEPQQYHLNQAIESALLLQEATRELGARRGEELAFSVGLHIGDAVVGYIGTDAAINYTAVGDTVNIAKRLQETAKAGQILIEEEIINQLHGGKIKTRELGELKFKNRQQSVKVYELLAYKELPKK